MSSPDRFREPAVLTSWKEVAAYLGKGVRTVQRWEKCDQLPVRRLDGSSKIIVHRDELDRWLHSQAQTSAESRAAGPVMAVGKEIEASRRLRDVHHELCHSLSHATMRLIDECRRAAVLCEQNFSDVPRVQAKAPAE